VADLPELWKNGQKEQKLGSGGEEDEVEKIER
jgi:hypothetical protein